ncbi:YciI family protein [Prochlorococcus marinus]|uniref:YciI family protein n=1 Tax=Prochlorococcus marinus TaxID=1219 RepID=UPI0022B4A41F|nr:hypothetical protein [Prochlorococcus marinus]
MSFFIKKEQFNEKILTLSSKEKQKYILEHKKWVQKLRDSGHNLSSGYLINNEGNPGGGGILLLEAKNFEEARLIIIQDPMIINNLVNWDLQEWIQVAGKAIY